MITQVSNAKYDPLKPLDKKDEGRNARQAGNEQGKLKSEDKVTLTFSETLRTTNASFTYGPQTMQADQPAGANDQNTAVSAEQKAPISAQQQLDNQFLMLRELVAKTFKLQGLSTTIDVGDGKTVNFEELTPQDAQKLIADDGYWGVEKTADRIFNLAIGVAGNDPTKIDQIREGVRRGFEMAKQDFGMELPEISYKTFDAVMKKLDDWSAEAAKGQSTQSAAQ
jgi:hypothetical protein